MAMGLAELSIEMTLHLEKLSYYKDGKIGSMQYYGCAPNAAKILMGNSQLGEYFRVFLCYAIIAIAIVSNAMNEVKAAKKKAQAE